MFAFWWWCFLDSTIVHHHEKPPCGDFFLQPPNKQIYVFHRAFQLAEFEKIIVKIHEWVVQVFFWKTCFSCLRQLQNQLHGEHINTPVNERSWLENGPFVDVLPTRKRESFHIAMLLYRREVKNSWAIFNCHHCWSEGVSTRWKSTWFLWCLCQGDIWVFPKIRLPQNGWFIMENPIKMDDLGGKPTILGNTPVA